MSQHDYNLANDNGAAFRADLNLALAAILSSNSGTSEPTTTAAYMFWADTTNGLLKQRNAADSGWITIGKLADFALGLVPANFGGTAGGTANAQTITLPNPPAAVYAGMFVWWLPATNTAALTLNPSGLGAVNVKKNGSLALLPGDTLSGKIAFAIHDGMNFQLLNPATGGKGTDVASASTVDLSGSSGDYADLTGTTTVNAFTLPEGRMFTLRAAGAVPLVNSSSLVIPGGSRTMAAGDYMILRGRASGVVHVVGYLPAGGGSLLGTAPVIIPGGNISTSGDTTMTPPAPPSGTWRRTTLVASGITLPSDCQAWFQVNGDTAAHYEWQLTNSNDSGTTNFGNNSSSGIGLSESGSKIDSSKPFPLEFEITVHNPQGTAQQKVFHTKSINVQATSSSRMGVQNGVGGWDSAAAITSYTLTFRPTLSSSAPTGTAVAPLGGTYYWICEP